MNELNGYLTPAQCAARMQVSEQFLAEKSCGAHPLIPVMKYGQKTRRYHWPSVVAAAQLRAGMPPQLITALRAAELIAARWGSDHPPGPFEAQKKFWPDLTDGPNRPST